MRRFEVLSKQFVIGTTDLESGDPPMGVAFGRFYPEPAYAAVRERVIATSGATPDDLELQVRVVGGKTLKSSGGVGMVDYSKDVGDEGIEVSVLGIEEPSYDDLFPGRYQAYEDQIRRRS